MVRFDRDGGGLGISRRGPRCAAWYDLLGKVVAEAARAEAHVHRMVFFARDRGGRRPREDFPEESVYNLN
eukprot:3726944-Pyramimonas_sp.AAC.1